LKAERRSWKIAGHLVSGLLLLGVFTAASAGALVFHLDLPAGRRFATRTVAGFLTELFQGSVEIDGIDKLSANRLRAGRVTVKDPEGNVVLRVQGLHAEFDGIDLLQRLLSSDDRLTVIVPNIRIDHADAFIEPHAASGYLGIARAFMLQPKPPSGKPSTSAGRVVRVFLPNIELRSGSARGHVGDLPLLEADVSNARGQVLVSPAGVAVDVPRFGTRWRGLVPEELQGIGSFHLRGDRHFWSSFDGYAGGLQLDTVIRLNDGKLDIVADVPQADPAAVRKLWPDWPLQAVADAHVEAKGPLDGLATTARLRVGETDVSASGVTRLSGELGVNLDVQGRHVDLRSLWPEAPASDIDAFTTLSLWKSPQGVVAELNGATEPTVLGGIDVPALDVTGTVEKGIFEARATAHEPGLPLRVDVTVLPNAVVDFEVRARRFRLEKSPRAQKLIASRGSADATIKGRFEREKLDATLEADVADFHIAGLSLDKGHVQARVRGSVDRPLEFVLDGRVSGQGLEAIERRWGRVRAQARGPLLSPEVTAALTESDGPDVDAKGRVSFRGTPRVTGLELALRDEGTEVKASAKRFVVTKDEIQIEDLQLVGAGNLQGSVSITPRVTTIDARGENVDLDVLSALLGLPRGKVGGRLTLDTDVTIAGDVQKGHVRAKLERGSIQGVSGLGLELEATLDDERATGSARAEIAGLARAATQFDLELAGKASDPESWRRATGRTEFRIDDIDLGNLVYLLPRGAGIKDVSGKLTGFVIASREKPDDLPSITALVGTQGLRVERTAAKGEESQVIEGIELQAGTRIDGPTGDVEGTIRAVDSYGSLVSAAVRSNLPLAALVEAPHKIGAELSRATLLGKVLIDQRPIETLPEFIRPKGMNGVLRADATLGGSFSEPLITAKTSLEHFVVGSETQAVPVDVCVQLDYAHARADFKVDGAAHLSRRGGLCQGRRVGQLRSIGQLNIGPSPIPDGPPRLFQGEALLALEGLPLEMIAPLAQAGLRGQARGQVVLEQDSAGLPQLNAKLDLADVHVENVAVGNGTLNVRSDGETLRAVASFEQGEKSRLHTELNSSLSWKGFEPGLDRGQPLLLQGRAENVEAVMLLPVLRDVFSELSGPMNGTVRLELEPDLQAAEDRWRGELQGELSMTGGAMQFNGLGMRLSNVRFKAKTVTRGGRTVIEVRDFAAASRARSVNVSASGDVYFEKLELVRARANVSMRDVPILIQGVSQANADGKAYIELIPQEDKMAVAISVPELTAELPPSSGRNVLALDANRSIEVLQPLTEPRKHKKNEDGSTPKPWELVFVLGENVKVVRSDMNIPLRGRVTLELGEDTAVDGTIQLKPGGRISLGAQFVGKTFVIEEGEVRFDTDDPSNPHLRVRASWRASDGTIVYLNISGTVREAKLRPESEPQLSDAEIYALLLGGNPGQEGGSAAAAGIGLTADVLGRVLSDTPLRNVELRTGSEQTLDERTYSTYTAAVQISDEIWFEGSYKSLNTSEVTEENEAFSGTVDWRFRRNWSLRTEVGTIGAGLDLFWTYHY
jgi:hypothetical protein